MIVPEVELESGFHRFPQTLRTHVRSVRIPPDDPITNPAIELIRPLIGQGELAVIICSYLHSLRSESTFFFILDDGVARDLVTRVLPVLSRNMKGTVGFIGYCAIQKVLEKNDVIDLLMAVGKSKFRIDPSIITEVIGEVESRCR